MRKQYIVGIILAIFWVTFNLLFWPLWRQHYYLTKNEISIERIVKKWGTKQKFDAEKFIIGGDDVRASMVGDLVQSKYYIGALSNKVYADLGNGEHSPQSDIFFNYKISGPKNYWNDNADYWLWLYEDERGFISKVVVYEYCCSNPYATYLHGKGWMKLK